ncbi:MAG: fused MFS/spermidine synthase [Chloroflexota bacterium]|nr:fused MFS/spermidine synthase [Chloroflexota bacterium]
MSRRAILAIFVLSGAAGLIYEVVWARQLVLVFGNTTQAVSAILTGFFGGMAIGSALLARLADRVRSPLRLYGLLEIALVVVVLLTPVTFRLLHEVYRGAYPSLEGSPQLLALTRFALSLLALGPATVMMGATLPALTRYLSTGEDHLSGAFARLYAANTVGAIAGTLLCGLVLIEVLGLTGALVVGAACSAVAGVVALLMARRSDRAAPAAMTRQPAAAPSPSRHIARPTLALLIAFVSGLTSLGYQVLWTRLLASGTGGYTYVFTVILAMFLTGIAIGAVLFSILRPRIGSPIALLAGAQVAVAFLALVGLVAVIGHPPAVDAGRPLETIRVLYLSGLAVVLPATIVLGLSFPAASALLDDRDGRVASAAGRLLAANTLGAISGTFLIPFVIVPAIGSPGAVVALALVNAATGIALALARLRRPFPSLVVASAGAVAIVTLVAGLLSPGAVIDPGFARVRDENGTIAAAAEDEIASVQAGWLGSNHHLWVTGTSMTLLTVDARLMPILPLMLRPGSTSALTVAFGMGSTYRTALRAGLQVEAAELVPSVPRMFGQFYPDAAAVLADPRGRVVIADGRNHVELTPRRYDIIVTDPPPPIETAGVSVISSQEYYQAGRDRLNPGGVMMQWVPNGQTVDEFKAHIRTFRSVFPNVLIVFGPGGYGYLMLGSDEPLALSDQAMTEVLRRPNVLEDLSSAYDSPEHTEAGWVQRIHSLVWIQGDAVARFAGDGPLITDDRPLPEYFLLRRGFGPTSPQVSPSVLRQLTGG